MRKTSINLTAYQLHKKIYFCGMINYSKYRCSIYFLSVLPPTISAEDRYLSSPKFVLGCNPVCDHEKTKLIVSNTPDLSIANGVMKWLG